MLCKNCSHEMLSHAKDRIPLGGTNRVKVFAPCTAFSNDGSLCGCEDPQPIIIDKSTLCKTCSHENEPFHFHENGDPQPCNFLYTGGYQCNCMEYVEFSIEKTTRHDSTGKSGVAVCPNCNHDIVYHYREASKLGSTNPNDIFPCDFSTCRCLGPIIMVPPDTLNKTKFSWTKVDSTGESIDHPEYYGGDTVYEAIKVIDAWKLNFNLGSVVKYIKRAGLKNGADELQDLKKAYWYLGHEIQDREQT